MFLRSCAACADLFVGLLAALVKSFEQISRVAAAWQEHKPATFVMMVRIASQATLNVSHCNESWRHACSVKESEGGNIAVTLLS